VANPELSPVPSSSELQPSQGIDRDGVRVDQRAHVEDDETKSALLEQRQNALAELRNVSTSNRTANDEDDYARS
jgi:hypothetical protein